MQEKKPDKARAEEKARNDATFKRPDPHPERTVEPDPEQEAMKKDLDKALKDTFPASDPVAPSQPTTAGAAERRKSSR